MTDIIPEPIRTIVVDDNAANLYYAGKILRSRGYSVVSAKSYHETMQALVTSDAEFMLADIRLGDMSGLELARIARGWKPSLRVLLMTAYRDEELRAADSGLPVLRIPFSSRELVNSIHRIFMA